MLFLKIKINALIDTWFSYKIINIKIVWIFIKIILFKTKIISAGGNAIIERNVINKYFNVFFAYKLTETVLLIFLYNFKQKYITTNAKNL